MNFRNTVYFALLVLSIINFSCKKPDSYPIRQLEINGIPTFINPVYPKNGKIEYDMINDLTIGADATEDEYIQSRPFQIDVDSNGKIYVLDWDDYRIQVYDSTGKYQRTIGRKGQGPGEFFTPAYFSLSPDDRLYLHDTRNKRLSVFTLDGILISSERYSGPYKSELQVDNHGNYYLEVKEDNPVDKLTDVMQTFIEKFSIERHSGPDEITSFGPFDGSAYAMKSYENGTISASSRHSPRTVWSPGPQNNLYAGHSSKYQLTMYDSTGQAVFAFGREFSSIPNPNAGRGPNTPFMPAFYSTILIDGKGQLWLRLYIEDKDFVLYDVWSSEGVYLNQVKLKHAVTVFRHNRAYAILRPAEDVPTIKRYKLVKMEQ